jgi:predicted nucleotidyltransferase component of viral defense system
MPDSIYQRQADLLLRILPSVMREDVFALKGGTAINFFWRDYPRLSVDIDLTYLPIKERDKSIIDISDRLAAVEARIKRIIPTSSIQQKLENDTQLIVGLMIRNDEATVKVEANYNLRGSVFDPVKKKLCDRAEKEFEVSVSVSTLSFEDLYGGKLVAALDRQHPRDLFDVKLLLENEGITPGIMKAFLFYLISHDRPMVEILNPGLQNISQTFINEFKGMTSDGINLDELVEVRKNLIQIVKISLTEEQKRFILSFKNGTPEWELSGIDGIENYPSVRWKLFNLERMSNEKHAEAYKKLEEYLL